MFFLAATLVGWIGADFVYVHKNRTVFPLLGCISKRLWTSQKKYHQSVESEVLAFSTSLSHSQTATGALWVFGCVGNDVSAAAAAAATIGLRVSIITLIIYSLRRRRATNCYRCQYYTPPCCLLLSFPTIFYLCSPRPLVILLFSFTLQIHFLSLSSTSIFLYVRWTDVTESMVTIRLPFCGYNFA